MENGKWKMDLSPLGIAKELWQVRQVALPRSQPIQRVPQADLSGEADFDRRSVAQQ